MNVYDTVDHGTTKETQTDLTRLGLDPKLNSKKVN